MFNLFKKNENNTIEEETWDFRSGYSLGLHSYNIDVYKNEIKAPENRIGEAHGTFEPKGEFRLVKLLVNDDYKKKGYGKSIIIRLMKEAKKEECTSFVFEGVSNTNTIAINIYKNFGASKSPIVGCSDKFDYVLKL